MSGINISCQILSGGQSSKVAVSSTSAQSDALTSTSYLVTPEVDVFVRTGANPTALSDGTDQVLIAGNIYRIVPLAVGAKLAFITKVSTDTGNVYITPGA